MGVGYNPKIVTSGLVGYWDAGNTKSYPGSGTTWYDIVGNNNGTLTNSPTYSNGSLVFDGSTNYVRTTSLPLTGNETNLTLSCWFRPNNVNTITGIMSIGNETNGTRRMLLQRSAKLEINGQFADVTSVSSTVLSVNTWIHITAVYTSLTLSSGVAMFVNGSQIPSSVTSGTSLVAFTNTFCTFSGTNATPPTNGTAGAISLAQIYNRALSAAEISQNFNATRGRFGI